MILIAMGANLPDRDGTPPLETCRAAARALANLPGTRLESVSRWYETAPVPPSGQPNYINGVARLTPRPGVAIDPVSMLADLQAIEARFGRQRGEPNAARTLDLDLIDLEGLVRDQPDPILPHPRAHVRAFVLLPLLDVAPDWVHPGNGRTATALLAGADQAGVRVLSASPFGPSPDPDPSEPA
jgi:2-amino-4-hydroxy-6-hydroxymethyldihydropteridine diphosphokinase